MVLSSSAIAPSTGPRSASEVITGPGRVARLLQHHYSTSIGLTQHTFGTWWSSHGFFFFFFFSKEILSHWYIRRVWRADCKNQQSHDVSSLWAVKEKAVFQSTGPRGHLSEWMLMGERTIYFYTKKFVQTDSKLLSPTQLPLWHRGQSDSDVKPCVCTVTCMKVLSKLKRSGC